MGLIQCVWCPLITKSKKHSRGASSQRTGQARWRKKAKLTTRQEGRPQEDFKPSQTLRQHYENAQSLLSQAGTMTRVFSCLYHFSFPYLRNYCDLWIFICTSSIIYLSKRSAIEQSFSPPLQTALQRPLSTAPVWTPALLLGDRGCPETLLICSAGWIVHACFYLLFFFFLVLFYFSVYATSSPKRK